MFLVVKYIEPQPFSVHMSLTKSRMNHLKHKPMGWNLKVPAFPEDRAETVPYLFAPKNAIVEQNLGTNYSNKCNKLPTQRNSEPKHNATKPPTEALVTNLNHPSQETSCSCQAHATNHNFAHLGHTHENGHLWHNQAWHKQASIIVFAISSTVWLTATLLEHFVSHSLGTYTFALASLIASFSLVKTALSNMRARRFLTIETLMLVSCCGAFTIGAPSEAAAVVTLYALGTSIEELASRKSGKSIAALHFIQPDEALIIEGTNRILTPTRLIRVGQTILTIAGQRIAADGVIVEGKSFVDESQLTGESKPVLREANENVFAGSIVLDGSLYIKVTASTENTKLARIIHLIQESISSKVPLATTIERFAKYYTPFIFILGAVVATLPPIFFSADWHTWIYRGLSLLLIGCPCALILSTPTSTTAAIAVAAKMGVLVKGGKPLEAIGRASFIAFDKTGTLTTGQPSVQKIYCEAHISEREILEKATAIEMHSSHPYASAIRDFATLSRIQIPHASEVLTLPGVGIEGVVTNTKIAITSYSHSKSMFKLSSSLEKAIAECESNGNSPLIVVQDSIMLGVISVTDTLRPEASTVVTRLSQLKSQCIMLTGDSIPSANFFARELSIPAHANLLPEEKLEHIDRLKQKGVVAMVGDGINDAPALARADVSIAMGGGTDLATKTADITLANNSLNGLVPLVQISRATMRNIQQNISIAVCLKTVFLITSIAGISSLWMAVLADSGAAVLVTFNALRILRFKKANTL